MHQIELQAHDLNLLVVLRALLDTRSVTGAARQLGLSPSATSHALGRLRDSFGDPLLVREGNGMVSTPRADALYPSLDRVLDDARLLYREMPAFDPATSTREFTIGASDLLAPLIAEIVARLSQESPFMTLGLVREVSSHDTNALASGGIDLALQAMPPLRTGLATRLLGQVSFVVVARADHPFLRDPTLANWCATPHVVVSTGRPGKSFVGEATARAGVERRIGLRVPAFLLAMHALAETDLLFAAPSALSRPIAKSLGLATVPLPLSISEVSVAAVWHDRFDGDPGHQWFRERVCEILSARLLEQDASVPAA